MARLEMTLHFEMLASAVLPLLKDPKHTQPRSGGVSVEIPVSIYQVSEHFWIGEGRKKGGKPENKSH